MVQQALRMEATSSSIAANLVRMQDSSKLKGNSERGRESVGEAGTGGATSAMATNVLAAVVAAQQQNQRHNQHQQTQGRTCE